MADLSTSYMNLDLPSPIIVGSSGLTYSSRSIERYEEAGAGAVVLKSIFEEQILLETDPANNIVDIHPEGADYFNAYASEHHLKHYLDLVKDAKKSSSIPVIASINCISASNWTQFASRLENAGADGLELNVFLLPSDPEMGDMHAEETLFEIVHRVLDEVSIPVAVKLSSYYSNFANTLKRLSETDVAGIVLFNRFYRPDINLEKIQLESGRPFSSPEDYHHTLRWIAISSGFAGCDLAASTGIHSGATVAKMLLAGASAVQMVSAVYKRQAETVSEANEELERWMEQHDFDGIEDFRGRLAQENVDNPLMYERVQFLKQYGQM